MILLLVTMMTTGRFGFAACATGVALPWAATGLGESPRTPKGARKLKPPRAQAHTRTADLLAGAFSAFAAPMVSRRRLLRGLRLRSRRRPLRYRSCA